MTVASKIAKLRRLADFQGIVVMHRETTDYGRRWSVWETRWANHENVPKWLIAEGGSPREALNAAIRRVRGEAVRERIEAERGSDGTS